MMENPAWVSRRNESSYFSNITEKFKIEDPLGFRDIFRMCVIGYEFVWSNISHLISPQEVNGGHKAIPTDEKLALLLRYMGTCESFQSHSHQFRISLNAVSCITKGCCEAMAEQVVRPFVRNPVCKQE